MKTFKFLAMAFACVAFTACQGDWDEPSATPFGNNSINDENIITIAQLKTQFPKCVAAYNNYEQITTDVKIRGRVTGNDIGSNIYKQFALQDETGAVIVAVNQSGMHGFLAEGQEIVMALKDLYIGSYSGVPEIGQPYNGSIGRMNKDIFQQHFKLVGAPDVTKIDTVKNFLPTMSADNVCRLVRIENVSFKEVEGSATFAPDSTQDTTVVVRGGCVTRDLKQYDGKELTIRTSTYAKFAARKLPYTKCNLTGIITVYNGTWQLTIRKESDIEMIEKE